MKKFRTKSQKLSEIRGFKDIATLIFQHTLMYKNHYKSLDFEATILNFSMLTCTSSQVAVPLFQFPPFWGKEVGGKEVP